MIRPLVLLNVTRSSFPELADSNSKILQGYTGPFKLDSFRKHQKSYQHQKCLKAKDAQLAPEATPLAICIKKMDEKMFNHLKVVFNVAYYIAKNKPFTDFEGLLKLTRKLGVEITNEYANDKRCKDFIASIASVIKTQFNFGYQRS